MIQEGYCLNCGYKIQDSLTICPHCGNKINSVSINSTNLKPNFKIVLFFFIAGIMVLEFLNILGRFIILALINNIISLDLIQIFKFLLEFVMEVLFILYLLKIMQKYDFDLNRSNLFNYIVRILVFAGLGSIVSILMRNYVLYPFLDSVNKTLSDSFVIMSPNELLIYLPLQVLYNSFIFLMLFMFAFLLQNRSILNLNIVKHSAFPEFVSSAIILGLFSTFYTSFFTWFYFSSHTSYFFLVNGNISSFLIILTFLFNYLIIIIPLIMAIILFKFIHFPITELLVNNFIFVFALVIVFKLLGIILFSSEVFYPGLTLFALIVNLETFNVQITLNLVISFFASLFLIQIYLSKITFIKANPILEKNKMDQYLETIEEIQKENSENQLE